MNKQKGETSYKETSFGIIPRSQLIPLEIEGVKRAWDFILQERKKAKILLTPSFIRKLHEVGFAWIFPGFGGKFRTIEVKVSNHIPPKYWLIPEYMDNYCKDIKVRLEHLPAMDSLDFLDALTSFLAWMHHHFLWIHPFKDYNGRVGRLLINVILLNLSLPPIELQVETKTGRDRYIQALQRADDGVYSNLEGIIREALIETTNDLASLKLARPKK